MFEKNRCDTTNLVKISKREILRSKTEEDNM